MSIVITGGAGFIMAHLVKLWAQRGPVTVLDHAPPDEPLRRWLGPLLDRVTFITAEVNDRATWARAIDPASVTYVVHGAAITPHMYHDAEGRLRSTDMEAPVALLEGNLMGTVTLLEWARTLPNLKRFIYVSSGSVYGDKGPTPLPEEGYVDPRGLYAISKEASERITRRYGEMFSFSAASVRLSGIYGALDRDTRDRKIHAAPFKIAALLRAGKPVTIFSPDAVADWLSADDVAEAITALLQAPQLNHSIYNAAFGKLTTVAELLAAFAACAGVFPTQTVAYEQAAIAQRPELREGRWGAYDISRITADTGWRPAPLATRIADYWQAVKGAPAPGQ